MIEASDGDNRGDGTLLDGLFATPAMARLFDDRARLQAMLDFEAALARAEAAAGVIPSEAAEAITLACDAGRFDLGAIGRAAADGGNLAIPMVKALTAAVGGDAGRYVHWVPPARTPSTPASCCRASAASMC